ncbi:MAG: hypothetical protein FD128_1588 [Hyphomonadaceae bacterium]|nr:MAG: hypothetical protein FD128_1588 [Hyphomonadaceae bacterium]
MSNVGWILFWGGLIFAAIFKSLADQARRYDDIEKTKKNDGIAAIGTLLALIGMVLAGCFQW